MGNRKHWLEWGLIAGLGAEVIRLHYGKQRREWWKERKQKPKRQRQLHPRTPEDGPFCQAYEPEWPTRTWSLAQTPDQLACHLEWGGLLPFCAVS